MLAVECTVAVINAAALAKARVDIIIAGTWYATLMVRKVTACKARFSFVTKPWNVARLIRATFKVTHRSEKNTCCTFQAGAIDARVRSTDFAEIPEFVLVR